MVKLWECNRWLLRGSINLLWLASSLFMSVQEFEKGKWVRMLVVPWAWQEEKNRTYVPLNNTGLASLGCSKASYVSCQILKSSTILLVHPTFLLLFVVILIGVKKFFLLKVSVLFSCQSKIKLICYYRITVFNWKDKC